VLAMKRQNRNFKRIRKDGIEMHWMRADSLEPEDFVFVPRKQFSAEQKGVIDLGAFTQVDGDYLTSRYMPLDEDTGFLFGQYVTQGSRGATGAIEFAGHSRQTDIRSRLTKVLERVWDLCPTEYIDGNSARLIVCCTALANVLETVCGKGALNKHLPSFAYDNVDFARGLLIGMWRGDGSFGLNASYSTSSEQLAYGVKELASAFGFFATIARQKRGSEWSLVISGEQEGRFLSLFGRIARPKVLRSRVIATDAGWLVPIRSIDSEDYSGPVYNLEVETDHSYCVEGIASHNCVEAQLCGCPVIVTNFSAMAELCLSGWRVNFHLEEHFPMAHQAWADIDDAVVQLNAAYDAWKAGKMPEYRAKARQAALTYDIDTVMADHMLPALLTIQDELRAGKTRAPKPMFPVKPNFGAPVKKPLTDKQIAEEMDRFARKYQK